MNAAAAGADACVRRRLQTLAGQLTSTPPSPPPPPPPPPFSTGSATSFAATQASASGTRTFAASALAAAQALSQTTAGAHADTQASASSSATAAAAALASALSSTKTAYPSSHLHGAAASFAGAGATAGVVAGGADCDTATSGAADGGAGTGTDASTPTPASNNASGGGCPDAQAALEAHNAARVQRGAAPLVWDGQLAAGAQSWSANCAMQARAGVVGRRAGTWALLPAWLLAYPPMPSPHTPPDHPLPPSPLPLPPLQHSGSGSSGQGENLFMSSGAATCADAVAAWASEASSYTGAYSPRRRPLDPGGCWGGDRGWGLRGERFLRQLALLPSRADLPFTSPSPPPPPPPQIVWKDTTHVGCGLARCGSGVMVTCRYAPPGNVLGAFAQNV